MMRIKPRIVYTTLKVFLVFFCFSLRLNVTCMATLMTWTHEALERSPAMKNTFKLSHKAISEKINLIFQKIIIEKNVALFSHPGPFEFHISHAFQNHLHQ